MAERSRLQFRHLSEVFETRDKAYDFLKAITNPDDTRSQRLVESLMGEPIVVKYKDNVVIDGEGNESFDERIILAIGVTGNKGEGVLGTEYHFIDSANIEKNVEELFEKVDGFEELFEAIIAAVGLNEDGSYSPVDKGHYISKAKSVKAATRLLDAAVKAVQDELDATQIGAGLNDDGSYEHVHNHVDDPYVWISKDSVNSLYDADKMLDKGIQWVTDNSINNVVINNGKEDLHVEQVVGVIRERVAWLDLTTTNLNLPAHYEEDFQEKVTEHHKLHNNMQLSEALAQLEANFHIATGATAGIHIEKIPQSELEANVREGYKLVNAEGIEAADSARIFIYKDAAFVGAQLGHIGASVDEITGDITDGTGADALILEYLNYEGKYVIATIDLGSFLRESEFKDGLTVNNVGEVRVKIDETSETIASGTSANTHYLTVSENGVKIDGIQYSIDATVTEEKRRAVAAEESLSGSVDTVINSVGLKPDGTYDRHLAADGYAYINSATTIDEATRILDKGLQDEVARAVSAETFTQNELDSVEGGLGFTEDGKYVNEKDPKYYIAGNTVVDDINRLDDAAYAIQEELDATQVGAGLNPDGSYHPHNTAPDVAIYISGATSLNEADYILDGKLKEESDRALAEEGNVKSWIGYSGDSGYIANTEANYISGATDMYDADRILDSKLHEIAEERQLVYEGIVSGAGLTYDASGAVVYKNHTLDEGFNFINSATSIDNATEILDKALQATNNGAGLNIDGSYKAKDDARYINTANSIANATEILDANLGRVEDALDAEVIRATEKENAIINGAGLSDSGAYTANTGSNYIIEATSLVDADNRIDAALKAESDRAIAAETAIASDLAALSAETLSNHVESEGKTIIVTKRAELTNLEVNIDNATLKQNDSGKIASTLQIEEVAKSGTNVRNEYALKDGNGNALGAHIIVPKDMSLKGVRLVGQSLEFTYILADGSEEVVEVDMSSFLYEGEFKDGLMTEGHIVKIKLADGNEKYLTVDENGLKLSGIEAEVTSLTLGSSDNSLVVNKTTDGTDAIVNVDGKTIVKVDGGALSTDLRITQNVLAATDTYSASYNLYDNASNAKGDTILIPTAVKKLKSVQVNDNKGDQKLVISHVLTDDINEVNPKVSYYNIDSLIGESDISSGLTVDYVTQTDDSGATFQAGYVKVKIDDDSEFIDVTEKGVRVKGISDAINTAKTIVKKGSESDHVTVVETIEDGHYIYTINDKDIASQEELDRTQGTLGLNEDGTISWDSHVHHFDTGSTLKDAIESIDESLENIEKWASGEGGIDDKLNELSGKTKDIQEELDRTQVGAGLNDDGTYTSPEDGFTSGATSLADAVSKLDSALQESTGNTSDLQDEVDRIEKGSGLQEDGTYKPHNTSPDDLGNYINSASSLDEADVILDNELKKTNDELGVTQEGVGLNPDGTYPSPESGFASGATSVTDAIGKIDEALQNAIDEFSGNTNGLQEELDRTQIGAGLQEDGSYKQHNTTEDPSNYIDKAKSLDEADLMLDKELKRTNDELDATQTGAGLNPDGSYTPNPDGFTSGATSLADAIEKLDETIQAASGNTKDLQDELDRTQVGAGLQEDGSYKPHNTSPDDLANYIDRAKSLDEADKILDEELKNTNDDLEAAKKGAGLNDDGSYTPNPDGFTSGATSLADAIEDLDETIQNVIDNFSGNTKDLQDELDRTQAGAGLNEDGTYRKHNTIGDAANYIADADSLDDADMILDGEIKKTNDELANTQKGAGLDEDGNYKANEGNEYTSGSTSLAGAIDDLDNALKKEVERLQSEVNTLTERIEALESANNDITTTIFKAVADMLRGTRREIKITQDREAQTIAIGFQDDAVFGNLIYGENENNSTVGDGDHNDYDPDDAHCDPMSKEEIEEIVANGLS